MAEACEYLCHGRVGAREGYWLTSKELILGNTQQTSLPQQMHRVPIPDAESRWDEKQKVQEVGGQVHRGKERKAYAVGCIFFFSLVVRLSGRSAPETEILFYSSLLLTSFQEQSISQPLASV